MVAKTLLTRWAVSVEPSCAAHCREMVLRGLMPQTEEQLAVT